MAQVTLDFSQEDITVADAARQAHNADAANQQIATNKDWLEFTLAGLISDWRKRFGGEALSLRIDNIRLAKELNAAVEAQRVAEKALDDYKAANT